MDQFQKQEFQVRFPRGAVSDDGDVVGAARERTDR